jgi:hypothetical protein
MSERIDNTLEPGDRTYVMETKKEFLEGLDNIIHNCYNV